MSYHSDGDAGFFAGVLVLTGLVAGAFIGGLAGSCEANNNASNVSNSVEAGRAVIFANVLAKDPELGPRVKRCMEDNPCPDDPDDRVEATDVRLCESRFIASCVLGDRAPDAEKAEKEHP